MKKYLIGLLILLAQITVNSQTKEVKSFNYLVGTDKIQGYALTTYTCDPTKYNISEITPAPILQVYKARKAEFIGGIMEDEKGQKTVIKDVTVETIGKDTIFTVFGKKFSRSFTLKTGLILKEELKCTVFYTNDIGIWKIYKK